MVARPARTPFASMATTISGLRDIPGSCRPSLTLCGAARSSSFNPACSNSKAARHHSWKSALAAWLGKEDGLLCQSGYTANLGLLQVIADPQTPVYLDSLAHMSLWEGARAAAAPSHAFRHNDPEHLSKIAARHGPGIVVVDSVYSTTGAVARLAELVEVARAARLHGAGRRVAFTGHPWAGRDGAVRRVRADRQGALHHGKPGQGICRAGRVLHHAGGAAALSDVP